MGSGSSRTSRCFTHTLWFESMSSSLSVSISFENYRMVHPYEDSDSSEDEVDWQDTRRDPYRAGEPAAGSVALSWTRDPKFNLFCLRVGPERPQTTPRRGFSGKGKNITTKHDEETCGRKNTARMENVRPTESCPP